MNHLKTASLIVFFLIFLFPFHKAFGQNSQNCHELEISFEGKKEKCNITTPEKSQLSCLENEARQIDKNILFQFTTYLENEKTAIDEAKRNGDYINSEGMTKEVLRLKAAEQNWEVYRKMECEVESGTPKDWISSSQNLSYEHCLYRVSLSRFSELCNLNESSAIP